MAASRETAFSWAVSHKHIRTNPFAGVKVDVPKTVMLREEGKSFNMEEAQVILRASAAITNLRDAFPRAKRWVLGVRVLGARSGEITQLRGIDVIQRGDFYAMKLTPEAGSIKTGNARTVPLHDHLVAQGFIEFVRGQGDGPLFYNPREVGRGRRVVPLNPTAFPASQDARAAWCVGEGFGGH